MTVNYLILFGICTIVAEFIPGSGVVPTWRIDAVKLVNEMDVSGWIIVLCQIAFVLFTIYFIVVQFASMWRHRWEYFVSYWSWLEWSLIGFAISAMAFFAARQILTNQALDTFAQVREPEGFEKFLLF
jgi:hypothetical protein